MTKITITPEQCKAGRNLLKWKQVDLSEKSEIGIATIADFERGLRNLANRTMKELIKTFEIDGIRFVDDEKEEGVVVIKNKKKK